MASIMAEQILDGPVCRPLCIQATVIFVILSFYETFRSIYM